MTVQLRIVARIDHRDDGDFVFFREFEVAGVMGRHGHDGPGSVTDQHIIGDPDRHRLIVHRVDRKRTGENAGLLLVFLTLAIAARRRATTVSLDCFALCVRRQLLDERVLGRDDHVGRAEQRIGASGIDPQHVLPRLARIAAGGAGRAPSVVAVFRTDVEIHFAARAASDPFTLHVLDAVGPVQFVQIPLEPVGIGRDPQHPLAQRQPLDRVAPPFALAVFHFFIGQHRPQRRAPVDQRVGLIGQTVFILIPPHR